MLAALSRSGRRHCRTQQRRREWRRAGVRQGSSSASRRRRLPEDTPTLGQFVANQRLGEGDDVVVNLMSNTRQAEGRSFHVETYGCQMNVSDTQVVGRILVDAGYTEASSSEAADIVLLNTCAIREKAEAKIWGRLSKLRHENKHRVAREGERDGSARANGLLPKQVGVLGCMAERLKERLLNNRDGADIVAGPDAYRDLPRLLQLSSPVAEPAERRQQAINVMLSQDETYADIAPLRTDSNGVSAFVSIMRGCNNMCAYCIVPFTRGRERSRCV